MPDRPDLESLTTKVGGKGYSQESPTVSGLRGFVCPRANAYGGRDGVIPPGIAAQHGLVPKGMRQIKVSDTAASAEAARADGKTEAERYKDYYGRNAAVQAQPAPVVTEPSPMPQADEQPVPPPARPKARTQKRAAKAQQAPESSGMFSPAGQADGDDDTLDGFYAGLKGSGFGTGEGTPAERGTPDDVGLAVPDLGGGSARNRVGRVSAPAPVKAAAERPRPERKLKDYEWQARLDAAERERDGAMAMAATRAGELHELQKYVASLNLTVEDLRKQLDEAKRHDAQARAETVRVELSKDEEKLKLGGEGWECRIMGAVHPSRTGGELVITVGDTSYAAELIAEMRPGPVVVVSASGRTSCAYAGNCVKLYGESGSADFIAVFRLTCTESTT